MSTYINKGQDLFPEYDDCTPLIRKYLNYLQITKNRSVYTVNSYYLDLRAFMRYLLMISGAVPKNVLFSDISVDSIPDEMLASVTSEDIESFLVFCVTSLGNQSNSMAHKLTSLRAFYAYLQRRGIIEENPAASVESPKIDRGRLPVYMTYDQCLMLLNSIRTEQTSRDYCIITFFLNCGMRISELVGINLSDVFITESCMRIIGKGKKERVAYLNDACQSALDAYLTDRALYKNIKDDDALFVSPRTGKRLTVRAVQKMVEKCLAEAGLSGMSLSPHKFRHTAATLMHEAGADMLTLQHILGHESVSTTEIYTHLNQQTLANAVMASPLANIEAPKRTGGSSND